ncbi:MAG: MarR family winged helix-turn-helix transcriptional regulator [Chloroflexota bacterium]
MDEGPTDGEVIDALEATVAAGVAITAQALARGEGTDLTLPMWRVLVVLGADHRGATVSEVARRIGGHGAGDEPAAPAPGGRGLVSLGADERDHRAVRARLTDAGMAFRADVLRRRRAAIGDALGGVTLGPSTRAELALIGRLLGSRP